VSPFPLRDSSDGLRNRYETRDRNECCHLGSNGVVHCGAESSMGLFPPFAPTGGHWRILCRIRGSRATLSDPGGGLKVTHCTLPTRTEKKEGVRWCSKDEAGSDSGLCFHCVSSNGLELRLSSPRPLSATCFPSFLCSATARALLLFRGTRPMPVFHEHR